jgi:hypothetical protein
MAAGINEVHVGFLTPFKDKFQTLPRFVQYADYCAHRTPPYFAVVQSSGYGKTRLVHEAAHSRFAFYVLCTRIGPMAESAIMPQLLKAGGCQGQQDKVGWYLAFFRKCLTHLSHFAGGTGDFFRGMCNTHRADDETFWSAVMATEIVEEAATAKLPNPVLFCFDEARALLGGGASDSPLAAIIEAASLLPVGSIAVIVTDTHSRVSQFQSSVDGTQNYPFYILPTNDPGVWDSDAQARMAKEEDGLGGFMAGRRRHPDNFFRLGRPLWNSVVNADPSRLLNMARIKLLNGSIPPTQSAMLALIHARIPINVVPGLELCNRLIASHMGTCCLISADQQEVHVGYPSEPILAAASASLLRDFGARALNDFIATASKKQIDCGSHGEFVGQWLMLRAVDSLCLENFAVIPTITAATFLQALLGVKVFDDLCLPRRLASAQLFFNHYIYMERSVDQVDLRHALIRGAAILPRRGQHGFDLLIPIVIGTSHVSVIAVQVKNRSARTSYAPIHGDSVEDLGLKQPAILLHCDFGQGLRRSEVSGKLERLFLTSPSPIQGGGGSRSSMHFVIEVHGFGREPYRCLPQKEAEHLKKFLGYSPDFFGDYCRHVITDAIPDQGLADGNWRALQHVFPFGSRCRSRE